MVASTRWWHGDESERFWLEATDREDIGADLKAPLVDEGGQPNWRYTLFQETQPGDVVLHYHKAQGSGGIVGYSRITGEWLEAPIIWGARGSYAREKGVRPHERPGYIVPLSNFQPLNSPLTLTMIRTKQDQLTTFYHGLAALYGSPLYFPFELSAKRPTRLLQGYAFKLPYGFLDLFPELIRAVTEAAEHSEQDREYAPPANLIAEGLEGQVRTRMHKWKERNRKLVNSRKAQVLALHGSLRCDVCGFDFEVKYGAHGRGFIECHHTKPLHTLAEATVTKLEDLALVCSNCHRMIHAATPWLTIEETRLLLR